MAQKRKRDGQRELRTADFERLAAFRHALRRFMHFSESATARLGLTGPQYQALLVVRCGMGDSPVTINDLAHQLLIRHNSAVGLVDRLADQGLLARKASSEDRRKVELRLTAKGLRVLDRLADRHRAELAHWGPELRASLQQLAQAMDRA